ncbi:hypothetical protein EGW08_017056 [Elysia chlorotica]|uniref:Uncharacterized protein n=1 Tax=Elysia chlorotica TaxID=188477 RepID=A0A433T0V4_ELYCH|nr:hypothetical protein EGW08_017056 [Elysia chlorotica]
MILLRRWQRYLRYLAAVVCIIVLITVIKQADLDDDADYDEYYEYKSSGRRGAARLQKLTGHGESGSGEDLAWLPGLKKHGGGKVLPVVVVEEHYEVLHYWFQAAEIGLIPKSGNILVHFDAHADVDMPETSSILPRFHYPKSRKEVKSLMQSSEKFIMAAVQSGLLNHIVWVMPSWSRDRTSPSSANIWFKLGTLMRRAPGDHKQNFCSCWVHVSFTADDKDQDRWLGYNFPSEDHNGWRCQTNEFSPLSEEDSGSEINPAQCSVHTLGLLQLVDSTEAADLLTSLSTEQQHLKDKRKILLDIDEDYFGVSSDSFDLSTIGLTLDETDILSDLIGDVFCADTTFDERVADMFHAALLNLLVNIKLQSCELKGESFSVNQRRRKCYTSLQMSNLLIEKIPRMVKFLVEVGEAEHILCSRSQSSWDSSLHTLLQNLILYLQNLSVQQLRHLAWLGICFDVSPSSMYFHQPLPLKLCRGHNNLNKTLVSSFHPSEEELETASEDLKRLLLSFKDRPSLVTLSRSIRDGCTPKELFHNIEGKVLEDLKSVFKGSLHGESIHFDSNLLGGKLGWPRRFPSWNNKLLKFLSVDVVADHYSGT